MLILKHLYIIRAKQRKFNFKIMCRLICFQVENSKFVAQSKDMIY